LTEYRIVARHVRYWRGLVHKWSTVYPLTGGLSGSGPEGIADQIIAYEPQILYPSPVGNGGGLYEVAVYDQATGGVPIYVQVLFDAEVPSDWIEYTGTSWDNLAIGLDSQAETAMQVEWNAGFSKSGKPVKFRKWYHSVPYSNANPGAADIQALQITNLEDTINTMISGMASFGVLLGRGSRLAAGQCQVLPMYGNHQMPRGRKRPKTKISSDIVKLPPGLLVVPGSDGSIDS